MPNCKGLQGKIYPLSLDKHQELDKFLDENLAAGKICISKSPYGSPIFFTKKKERSLCPVEDYHKLNEFTVKTAILYP